MAQRGLVLDLEHRGERWVALAPVVIGFFEFTFMPVRDDAPMEELAFERATRVVADATTVAVSRCPCRTHADLLGRACGAPVRTCLSFDGAAEALLRSGLAEPISNAEGLEILDTAKAAGLAQTADNVEQRIAYLCNCCGCCCGMMQAIREAGLHDAIVPSNWIARIDPERCCGCRDGCVTACPAEAVERRERTDGGRWPSEAVLDAERCLGCGVCVDRCRFDALELVPRERRPFTPDTTLDRMIAMVVERGKLGDLLLDTLDGAGPVAVARLLQHLERSSLGTSLRAIDPLRSVFLRGLPAAVHRGAVRVPTP